jgi:hypothetical protein
MHHILTTLTLAEPSDLPLMELEGPVRREGSGRPTESELEGRLAQLPPDRAQAIRARARPAPLRPDPEVGPPPPPPRFASWADFLDRTTAAERRRWCADKARTANGPRLMSEQPEHRITSDDVLRILEAAEGRCHYCGSLAVEKRPPGPWNRVGRRIGTLHHAEVRFLGGPNTPDNLVWACMWCSTWPLEEERRPGAVDRGGYFP